MPNAMQTQLYDCGSLHASAYYFHFECTETKNKKKNFIPLQFYCWIERKEHKIMNLYVNKKNVCVSVGCESYPQNKLSK